MGIFAFLGFKYRKRFYSQDKVRNYQLSKAKSICKYAVANSPFFKRFYERKDIDDFYNLPITNKKIMMDNLTEYNTLNLKKEELVEFALEVERTRDFTKRFQGINIGMSSGTSGNKGIIITTREEEDYAKTMYLSRLVLPKGEKVNCAFILRITSPAFNYNKFGNRLTYISQLQPMEKIVNQIQALKPNVLAGPPSMLKLLAIEQEKGKLSISPNMLYSYAEVLHDDIKALLENVFGCNIYQIYQGSEGYYAVSCEKGSLHVNEDMTLMELYDKDWKPAPDGEPCYRLLVTDLHKKSQPIIRYELNDIITISPDKCACGSSFRVIEKIQGRADDIFWGLRKGTKQRQFIFQDYISRAIISASDKIQEYQAIQKSYTQIVLRIMLDKDTDKKNISEALQQAIKEIFKRYDCIAPRVNVTFREPLRNERSNKLIRIICQIKGEKNQKD